MHRAYPIDQYPAKCKHAAAMMHMIMNNLDPQVAQVTATPYNLIPPATYYATNQLITHLSPHTPPHILSPHTNSTHYLHTLSQHTISTHTSTHYLRTLTPHTISTH